MSLSTESHIPFARPVLAAEEEQAVLRVLRSGWLTTGAEAAAFEQEFARTLGVRFALAVSSCTAALHLALEAAGIGAGDLVALSPYTFTASAEVIRYLGADPVFVDIDPATLNIDPQQLAEACAREERIKAIIPVHIGGRACDMDRILRIAAEHECVVIEDAAHAFPGTRERSNGGRCAIGTEGEIGTYSFYANKTITTGEGGMLTTDREEIAERVRIMRLHGIDRPAWNRYTSTSPAWQYDVVEAGYKYNLPDVLAAIGRAQLKKAQQMRRRRLQIAERYRAALGGLDLLTIPDSDPDGSWHLFVIQLELAHLSIDRDAFVTELSNRGVGTSVHYIPLHLLSYYRDRYRLQPEAYPVSLRCYRQAISLPIYPALTDDQVERVIDAVISVGRANRNG